MASDHTRRDFLRLLGAATVVTAAGLIVPRRRVWQVSATAPVGGVMKFPNGSTISFSDPALFDINASPGLWTGAAITPHIYVERGVAWKDLASGMVYANPSDYEIASAYGK
jgi:hypothetical protein